MKSGRHASYTTKTQAKVRYTLRPLMPHYFRHLAGQVSLEWQELEEKDAELKERLLKMAKEIVPYHMAHNAEAEACDLLMEIERLDLLQDYVDETAYNRVCLYLTRLVFNFRNIVKFNKTTPSGC